MPEGLVGAVRGVGGRQEVADLAGRGLEVEPGGGALADAGLDLAVGGGEVQRAAGGRVDAHLAVLGGRPDRGEGALHGDVAAGAVQAERAGRLADPDLPVGGAGLAVLVDLPDRDVAGRRAGVEGRRPVDPDVAVAVVDPHVAEPALAVDVAGGQRRVERRALRDQELDVDRRHGAEEQQPGTAGRGDHEPPVGELDARLVGGLAVGGAVRSLPGRTVTTVSARSPARTRSEPPESVDADLDGGGGVERRHDRVLCGWCRSGRRPVVSAPSRSSAGRTTSCAGRRSRRPRSARGPGSPRGPASCSPRTPRGRRRPRRGPSAARGGGG